MKELEQAIKNICLNPQTEDHELIFDLYKNKHDIDTRYKEIKANIKSKEKLALQQLQNALNISLIEHGYETIDTNIELKDK